MKYPEENIEKYKDISGIILSGGKSTRAGTDKAFLKFGNKTIIESVTNLMKSLFQRVFIITNTPSKYRFLNVPVIEDIYKNKGPLAGIHSGLIYSKTEKNFIISCDMPLMSSKMIEYIINFKSPKPVKYCIVSGYHHHLAGFYSKSIIPEIEKILSANASSFPKEKRYSIKHLLKNVEAEIIAPEGLLFFTEDAFFNLNTPEDYKYLKEWYKAIKV